MTVFIRTTDMKQVQPAGASAPAAGQGGVTGRQPAPPAITGVYPHQWHAPGWFLFTGFWEDRGKISVGRGAAEAARQKPINANCCWRWTPAAPGWRDRFFLSRGFLASDQRNRPGH